MKKYFLIIVAVASFGSLIYYKNEVAPPTATIEEPVEKGSTQFELPREASFEDALESITANNLKNKVKFLSSAKMEGRLAGEKGNLLARNWIAKRFKESGLEPLGDNNTYFQKFPVRGKHSYNVIGMLPGNDPKLKNEIIIISGHFDHIGLGPAMSTDNKHGIHHGANDNGTGSCATVELAEAFSLIQDQLKRSVLFITWSGEEEGLVGSNYFVKHPTISLNKICCMINMDMIGTLSLKPRWGGKKVDLDKVINQLKPKYPFINKIIQKNARGGGSDHAPFSQAGVPTLFIHTGIDANYHKITDTYEKLDYPGMEKIVKMICEMTWIISQKN